MLVRHHAHGDVDCPYRTNAIATRRGCERAIHYQLEVGVDTYTGPLQPAVGAGAEPQPVVEAADGSVACGKRLWLVG
jgi:hypothetical protein